MKKKEEKAKNGAFNYTRFSSDILDYRNRKGITLHEFSELAGLGVATVQRAEAGKKVDIATLIPIANLLDIQVQAYFK